MSKAIADIRPCWYLLHYTADHRVGPFETVAEAAEYRHDRGLGRRYAVTRTSRAHPNAEVPTYIYVANDDHALVGPFQTEADAGWYAQTFGVMGPRVLVTQTRIPARRPYFWAVARGTIVGPFASPRAAAVWRFRHETECRVLATTYDIPGARTA